MDPRLDRLFSSLEAQFGAELDRAEDEAARDLAVSLRQDLDLRQTLLRGPCSVITPHGIRPVYEVAKDHLKAAGPTIVPIDMAVVEAGGTVRPRSSEVTLLEALRPNIRSTASIAVNTGEQDLKGRLVACSHRHLLLQVRGREVVIPLGRVRLIRLSHED